MNEQDEGFNKLPPLLASVFMCLLVAGCAGSIDGWQIKTSQDICEDHGGIDYLNLVNSTVMCNDGHTGAVQPRGN